MLTIAFCMLLVHAVSQLQHECNTKQQSYGAFIGLVHVCQLLINTATLNAVDGNPFQFFLVLLHLCLDLLPNLGCIVRRYTRIGLIHFRNVGVLSDTG